MVIMSLDITLKTAEGKPFVAQIYEQFREKIQRNELHDGDKVPSMREVATHCGVSLGIVKQAFNTLTTEGYLRSHPGRGLYVVGAQARRRSSGVRVSKRSFRTLRSKRRKRIHDFPGWINL